MGFGKFIRQGVGLLGKTALGVADHYSGGLASKIAHGSVKFLDKNAGTIGKVARTLGKSFLSDETRNKIHNYTQTAIKYMPEGSVRTALNKISQAAQGKKVKEGAKLKTPDEIKAAIKNPAAYKAKEAAIEAKHKARKEKHEAKRAERHAASTSIDPPVPKPASVQSASLPKVGGTIDV